MRSRCRPGQLYVTRGLIALASDTSELSSVLSHEMAHVLAKHASIREDQARQAAIVTRVVTDMGNDPDLTALALAKTKLTMASFSRQQEFEADGIGVGISARAHFDPYGAARFLTRDGAQCRAEGRQDLARSARAGLPVVASGNAGAGAERAGQCAAISPRRTAASATARPISPPSTTSSMARIRAKVSCAAGASCIRSSASPFTAPETFTLDNTAQAVIGVREGGTQAMRFDVVRVPAEQTLGDYLNSGWMENVDKSSTEDITINGFPAASAIAHGDQWQFKVYALRFGSDVYRFIFAARQKTTESDRNARETVNSFRRLTLEEIQAARPLRIKVITVQPGDTVESLSHRMAGVDRPPSAFGFSTGSMRTRRSRRATASRSWWIDARTSSRLRERSDRIERCDPGGGKSAHPLRHRICRGTPTPALPRKRARERDGARHCI